MLQFKAFPASQPLCHPCSHSRALVKPPVAPVSPEQGQPPLTPELGESLLCGVLSCSRPREQPRYPGVNKINALRTVFGVRPGHLSSRGTWAMGANHTTQWSTPSQGSSRALRSGKGHSRVQGGWAGRAS